MYKIGIIGERDSVLGFMAIGFAVHEAPDAETARTILHSLAKDESYAIIFIVENYAEALVEDIARYKDVPLPAVISIPGRAGSSGYGMAAIKIESAIFMCPFTEQRIGFGLKHEITALIKARPDHFELAIFKEEEGAVRDVVAAAFVIVFGDEWIVVCGKERDGLANRFGEVGRERACADLAVFNL